MDGALRPAAWIDDQDHAPILDANVLNVVGQSEFFPILRRIEDLAHGSFEYGTGEWERTKSAAVGVQTQLLILDSDLARQREGQHLAVKSKGDVHVDAIVFQFEPEIANRLGCLLRIRGGFWRRGGIRRPERERQDGVELGFREVQIVRISAVLDCLLHTRELLLCPLSCFCIPIDLGGSRKTEDKEDTNDKKNRKDNSQDAEGAAERTGGGGYLFLDFLLFFLEEDALFGWAVPVKYDPTALAFFPSNLLPPAAWTDDNTHRYASPGFPSMTQRRIISRSTTPVKRDLGA